ncbi:Lrp/AsnC family transcriptional regulator [Streptomyces thinghirensis]|uniref:Transcription regulator AsnC/Lrp ligand binding domain-containing protein n=1 Tax=Streptomyces thinghirensis TaxID=551547 RepID=A0ABP9T4F7_9ACTN
MTLDASPPEVTMVLGREPRAGLADVGTRVGVHERTVARRLERMTGTGLVRFTAALVPEYLGEGIVAELAVTCLPGRVHETATAPARRTDVWSVEVATGDLQVFAELQAHDHEQLFTAVDEGIGRIEGVRDVHSSVVLRSCSRRTTGHPSIPSPPSSAVRSARAAPCRTRPRSTAPSSRCWNRTRGSRSAVSPASCASARPRPGDASPG